MVRAPSELALSLDKIPATTLMRGDSLGITVGSRRPARLSVTVDSTCRFPPLPIETFPEVRG
jgi:hypothetical protein